MRLTKKEWETLGWECSDPSLSYVVFENISSDSREFKENWIFFAHDGLTHKARDFIPAITLKSPAAIFVSRKYKKELLKECFSFPVFFSKRFSEDASSTVSYIYADSSKKLTLIGITGTNGKSSVAVFLQRLLKNIKKEALYIGTLGASLRNRNFFLENTTPNLFILNRLFKEAVTSKIKYAVLEVSSHALDQDRVRGLDFSIAAFTNLTQDHLDYHKSMRRYFNSKKKLFKSILAQTKQMPGKFSAIGFVIHIDDPYGLKLYKWLKPRAGELDVLTLGSLPECDLKITQIKTSWEGTETSFFFQGKPYCLKTRLIGNFSVLNILIAILIGFLLGFSFKMLLSSVKNLKAVRGRVDVVYRKKDRMILIDYAHTPDALEKILLSLRELQPQRVILIFGCGGDRDKSKRAKMGEISSRFADVIILTNDNPRSEEPTQIIEDIQQGIKNKTFDIILDRRKAIHRGIKLLQGHSFLLVAGKGHEEHQIIGKEKKYFCDHEIVKEGIKKYLA